MAKVKVRKRYSPKVRKPARSVLELELRAMLRRAQLGAQLPAVPKPWVKPLEIGKRSRTAQAEAHVIRHLGGPQSRRFDPLGPSSVVMPNAGLAKLAGLAFAPHQVRALKAGSAALGQRLAMVATKGQMALWRKDRAAALAAIKTRSVNCIPRPAPGSAGGSGGASRPRRFIPFCG